MADKYYGVERRAVNSEMWEQVLLSRCMCDELFQEGYLLHLANWIWKQNSDPGQPKRHVPHGSHCQCGLFLEIKKHLIYAPNLEKQVVLKCLYKYINVYIIYKYIDVYIIYAYINTYTMWQ